jgi:hypothetical protein
MLERGLTFHPMPSADHIPGAGSAPRRLDTTIEGPCMTAADFASNGPKD